MSYATIDDIFKRYPVETLVGSADNSVASVSVSSVFIADAESLVDGYICNRYVVPLDPVPSFIKQVTCDIAIFNMLVEKLPQVPDFFQPRYDRAMDTLLKVNSGTIKVASNDVATAGDQEVWSSTEDFHPVFSPVLDPIDQAVDKDQVDSDKDDRISDV